MVLHCCKQQPNKLKIYASSLTPTISTVKTTLITCVALFGMVLLKVMSGPN